MYCTNGRLSGQTVRIRAIVHRVARLRGFPSMSNAIATEETGVRCGDAGNLPIAFAPPGKEAPMARSSTQSRGPGFDLRSSASAAAIELDNIILGRGTKTIALTQLLRVLESGIPAAAQRTDPMAMITPTVAVMDRVVRRGKPKAILDEVISEYDSFVDRLKRVALHPNPEALAQTDLETIEALRATCLALSRFASSLRRPPNLPVRNPRRS
jgi:hypothetical protein